MHVLMPALSLAVFIGKLGSASAGYGHLYDKGMAATLVGDFDDAHAHFTNALQQSESREQKVDTLHNLGTLEVLINRPDAAASHHR